jgi:hypothetical protein
MTTLSPGAFLGIAISALALIGSLIGTVSVVLGAQGKSERRYLAISYAILWLVSIGFLVLCFVLPVPWTYVALGVFFVSIPVSAFWITRRSLVIRRAEKVRDGAAAGV